MIIMAGFTGSDNSVYIAASSDWPAGTVYANITYPNGPSLGMAAVDDPDGISFPVQSEYVTNPMVFTIHAYDAQQTLLTSKEFACQIQ